MGRKGRGVSRYIDADDLEKAIYKWMPKDQETWMDSEIPPIENLVVSIMMTIEEQETIDAEPVRHGKWIRWRENGIKRCKCSECFTSYGNMDTPYCPNCGAKMDGERKEE